MELEESNISRLFSVTNFILNSLSLIREALKLLILRLGQILLSGLKPTAKVYTIFEVIW